MKLIPPNSKGDDIGQNYFGVGVIESTLERGRPIISTTQYFDKNISTYEISNGSVSHYLL